MIDGRFPTTDPLGRLPDALPQALSGSALALGLMGGAGVALEGLAQEAGGTLDDDVRATLAETVQACLQAGDYAGALEPSWLLAYDDPLDAGHAINFAWCLQQLGDLSFAARLYATALVSDPANGYCLYRLGECLEGLGHEGQARAVYEAALDLSRKDAGLDEVQRHAQQRLDALSHPTS